MISSISSNDEEGEHVDVDEDLELNEQEGTGTNMVDRFIAMMGRRRRRYDGESEVFFVLAGMFWALKSNQWHFFGEPLSLRDFPMGFKDSQDCPKNKPKSERELLGNSKEWKRAYLTTTLQLITVDLSSLNVWIMASSDN